MIDLILIVVLSFIIYFFVILRPTNLLTANSLFVYVQFVMAIGTLPKLDPRLPSDTTYAYVIVISLLCYLGVSGIAILTLTTVKPAKAASDVETGVEVLRPTLAINSLVALSIVVVVTYFSAVGYSALFQGLRNSLLVGSEDIASLRLDSYSGDRYLYPGYVNQFKNVLLPALSVFIFTYWIKNSKPRRLGVVLLTAVSLFGLLGTGQRGPFIQFAIAVALYLYLLNGSRFPKGSLKLGLGVLAITALSTLSLGRGNAALESDSGLGTRIVANLQELPGRVFTDQQASAIAGFRYIYGQPLQWGREWAEGLTGVLPGRGGSDLSNKIFATLYGTDRGTSPPSIWGSAYYNFGWVGVVILPVLLAAIIVAVSRRAMSNNSRNSLELLGIAGASATLGLWVSGSPDALLNSGLAVYVFLWLWGSRESRVRASPAAPPELMRVAMPHSVLRG